MKQCGVFSLFLVIGFLWVNPVVHAGVDLSAEIDLVVVQEKIQALGVKDNTLPYNEWPIQWLKQRRESILPQLFEGLDAQEERIGVGCLEVLSGLESNEAVREKYIKISRNRNHIIYESTLLTLCACRQDKQTRPILHRALNDLVCFPDRKDRATIAEALGQKAKAVELLIPIFKKNDSDTFYVLRRLEALGHMSAVPVLEELSKSTQWGKAAYAYRVLATIDPTHHALTEDQIAFLKGAGMGGKGSYSMWTERWIKLSQLDRTEVRPFVLQMLESERSSPAVKVLELWQDKEALPIIRRLMQTESQRFGRSQLWAMYIAIEDTDASISEVCARLRNSRDQEDVVRSVNRSLMPEGRKRYVLNQFRLAFGSQVVAKSIRLDNANVEAIKDLMQDESDLVAMEHYIKMVCKDTQKRFTQDIYDALKRMTALRPVRPNEILAMQSILDACGEYALPGSGLLTDQLLTREVPVLVRLAGARVSAMFGGNRDLALHVLYEGLNERTVKRVRSSVRYLGLIPCLSDQERSQRETLVLTHLKEDDPSKEDILRLLATCSSSSALMHLEPLLDSDNAQRAVYAAWILAQHPDKAVQDKGLRRLAIYAMFRYHMYQSGFGIEFDVTPEIRFRQVLESGFKTKTPAAGLAIPDALLEPFTWDESEQAFAIRAYRLAKLPNDFEQDYPSLLIMLRTDITWDDSHCGLFEVMAREDPYVIPWFVKGEITAHFKHRKTAAKKLAEIRQAKASYLGLSGEAIDSEAFPTGPYDVQNQSLATHFMDLIQAASDQQDFGSKDWRYDLERAANRLIREWTDEVGKESAFTQALMAESRKRDFFRQ